MLDTNPSESLTEPVQGSVRLPDGRRLAYAEYGDRTGEPVFHFHGHPGSRLEAAILHEQALELGIRLMGLDRPGMGYSDFLPGRRILDWPIDVVEVADALGLDEFGVQGISGGGPYAAAAARLIPKRLSSVSIISGAGPDGLGSDETELPINRLQRRLVRYAPFVLNVAFASMARSVRKTIESVGPVRLGRSALSGLPTVDQRALASPELAARYGAALSEALVQGGRGAAWDAKLLSRDWGFDVSEIDHPNLHIWHGSLDENVSIATGRAMANRISGAFGHFYENEGHISVAVLHARDILSVVLQDGID